MKDNKHIGRYRIPNAHAAPQATSWPVHIFPLLRPQQ